MTHSHPMATLRALLHKAPSIETFAAILQLIENLGEEQEIGLAYTREHLNEWPDEMRLMPCEQGAAWDTPPTSFDLVRALHNDNPPRSIPMHFLQRPWFSHITSLQLEGDDIYDETAVAIAENPSFAQLQTLRLDWTGVTAKGLYDIANSSQLTQLTTLRVSGSELLDSRGDFSFDEAPALAGVRSLTLATGITHASDFEGIVEALAHVATLSSLETLQFYSKVDQYIIRMLKRSKHLSNLKSLRVYKEEYIP